jgi:hypothetical protein
MFNFRSKGGGVSDPNVISLKGGQSIVGVLKGDLHEFEKPFKPGEKPKFRFRVNFIMKEDGKLVARILEQGWKVYKQLEELQLAGWNLKETKIRVSRQGTTQQDTIYTVTAMPEKIPPAALEEINKVKLHPLDGAGNQQSSQQDANEDVPF